MSLLPSESILLFDQCCFLALPSLFPCPAIFPVRLTATQMVEENSAASTGSLIILSFTVNGVLLSDPLTTSSCFAYWFLVLLGGWYMGFEAEWPWWRLHCFLSPTCLYSTFAVVLVVARIKRLCD